MRRAVFEILFIVLAGVGAVSLAAAPRKTAPPAVKEAVEGAYTIMQLDREIGVESFSRTVYDNNTVVLEARTVTRVTEPDSMVDTSSLTLEEDSYFLIDYRSSRNAGKLQQKTSIDVYANVAHITTDTNGRRNTLTKALPTGVLCVQSSTASNLEMYLKRYNDTAGGKQSILVFDPLGKREYTKVLEKTGQEQIDVLGTRQPCTVYALQDSKGIQVKFYVDATGRVVRAEIPLQRMTFVLAGYTVK